MDDGTIRLDELLCSACMQRLVPMGDGDVRIVGLLPSGDVRAYCSPDCARRHGWPWVRGQFSLDLPPPRRPQPRLAADA